MAPPEVSAQPTTTQATERMATGTTTTLLEPVTASSASRSH